jgi:hypothetical protein
MTIKNANAARRIVSARLQSYFATVKEHLFMSSEAFSKKLEDDLTLTEARDQLR